MNDENIKIDYVELPLKVISFCNPPLFSAIMSSKEIAENIQKEAFAESIGLRDPIMVRIFPPDKENRLKVLIR